MEKDYTFRQWVAEWPDDVAKKQNILHLIDRNGRPDFCPPSVEKQPMAVESAQLDEEGADEESYDTMQGSKSPSSDEQDPKASSLVDVSCQVESTSEETVKTTSNLLSVTGQNLKATRMDMTFTVAMFLLGVITTVMLQLFLSAIAGKAK
ncbi:hypothetical protein QBC45DRAFT_397624 [Copromyces sp. CBS 386.78]|nr:hypothetical protein QBC45DRAFT_397624 [Copromyces sp. CBS 386.78]